MDAAQAGVGIGILKLPLSKCGRDEEESDGEYSGEHGEIVVNCEANENPHSMLCIEWGIPNGKINTSS
jgi:hypothetical protein